ncbi:MAG: KOW domain-containing RNA-binding protein [Clostridia bacterium]|nr:KOW domain-containing RNA-binding protein [Clostridia bacterium]MBN2884008.1 KOW domain-containing RNA-binding protein [Clostridia bacterium]
MDANPGQLVLSKAGRDKGKKFIITAVDKESGYAHIVDGKLRRVENPKKKKLKHLEVTGITSSKIAEKIKEGKPLQNPEIVKEIKLLETEEIK